jgi:hypothetical protein
MRGIATRQQASKIHRYGGPGNVPERRFNYPPGDRFLVEKRKRKGKYIRRVDVCSYALFFQR